MKVYRADQLCRTDFFPDAKIDSTTILPYHPSQEHVQSLACGIRCWRGNMFFRPGWYIFEREKIAFESDQAFFNVFIRFLKPLRECIFKRIVPGIMHSEKFNEVQKIGLIEGSVFEQ